MWVKQCNDMAVLEGYLTIAECTINQPSQIRSCNSSYPILLPNLTAPIRLPSICLQYTYVSMLDSNEKVLHTAHILVAKGRLHLQDTVHKS